MRQIIYASATLIGMIIGVGIFGVPYVTAQAGFTFGVFWILFLGSILLLMNLFYGQVALATPEKHRLAGYANYHLGKKWKYFATCVNLFSFWGALIAYIIVGGKFLYLLLGGIFGGTEFIYNIIFFVVMSLGVWGGLKAVKTIELSMSILLLVVIFSIFAWSFSGIDFQHFLEINWNDFLVPYGIVLFALTGAAAIPEMIDIVEKDRRRLNTSIILGSFMSVLIAIFFVFAVVGIAGDSVSPEALESLKATSGNGFVIFLGLIFGILALSTSFLILGLNLKEVFQYDYGLNKIFAFLLAIGVPLITFLGGAKSFIEVIDFTGGVLIGLEAIIIISLFLKIFFSRKTFFKSPFWIVAAFVSLIIFLLGVINELTHIF